MEQRKLGNTDMRVGVLGLGGSEIGYEDAPAATARRILDSGVDCGLNVIDTAECYLTSEELIGRAVQGRRKEFYIFTKCGHPRAFGAGNWSAGSILETLQRSLKRLRTDYVDLLQLHSCSEAELRKGDVIETVQRARERGYTRYIGYSGDGKAAAYAVESGAFDTLQTSINIAEQEALDLALPLAREANMGVIAKRPLANVAWRSGNRRPPNPYAHTYWERLQKLEYGFLEGDLTESVRTALRFTLSVPGVHLAIVGTTKPERMRQNAAAVDAGPLPQERFEAIRARWRAVADATWVGQT